MSAGGGERVEQAGSEGVDFFLLDQRELIVFETVSTLGRGKASQCGCCRAGSELLEPRPRRRASRTQGPC